MVEHATKAPLAGNGSAGLLLQVYWSITGRLLVTGLLLKVCWGITGLLLQVCLDIIGLLLQVGWGITGLRLTEQYCVLAPRPLTALIGKILGV